MSRQWPLVLAWVGMCASMTPSAIAAQRGALVAATTTSSVPTAASLGAKIFSDPSLSASGALSCASCHSPSFAHASPPGTGVVPSGGIDGTVAGFRTAPSLRYLNFGMAFFFDDEGTPTGGFDRDGRAQTPMEQAERPLLSAHEMGNADHASVVAKLRVASYANEFRQVFGAQVFDDVEGAFFRLQFALQEFENNAADLHPFDSKYDLFLKGKVKLSAPELRGLALFNRADKGNCAGCHPSARGGDGSPPLFTDYTYDNLGVPRNSAIPATENAAYFDLGLCGPDRTDLVADHKDLCGAFKVPTLRNVATRSVFFHNGRFTSLLDALHFYVRRDTNPEEFYPVDAHGVLHKFDDLPAAYVANVNTSEVPYDRHPGQAPRLDEAEISDVIAFLNTLTDGYDPATDTADPARNIATH